MSLAVVYVQILRTAISALARELAAWKISRGRALFGAQVMLSVALSVAFAHALHLSNTWWAAISGFAVMQTSFTGSMRRAAHRLLGTLAGAALGTVVGPLLGNQPWLFVPMLAAMGAIAVYYGNGSKFPYAWILGGMTALMVTYEAHQLLAFRSTALFAGLRLAEVVVGTFACVLVAALFHFGARWHAWMRPSPAATPQADAELETPTAAPLAPSSHPARMLLCLQGALAVGIIAAFAYYLHLPGFAQAMVTTTVVLILPASLPADQTRQSIIEKMVHRTVGCLLAGALGVALLPLLQGHTVLCLLALSLGVWLGSHVQTGREGASYVGRQFTIAFIMVFVQDHHWSADPIPALMRLTGILTGIVVLTGVILATAKLRSPPSPGRIDP